MLGQWMVRDRPCDYAGASMTEAGTYGGGKFSFPTVNEGQSGSGNFSYSDAGSGTSSTTRSGNVANGSASLSCIVMSSSGSQTLASTTTSGGLSNSTYGYATACTPSFCKRST